MTTERDRLTPPHDPDTSTALAFFAWTVGASEDARVKMLAAALAEARAEGAREEREACAAVCDEVATRHEAHPDYDGAGSGDMRACARRIRARGAK